MNAISRPLLLGMLGLGVAVVLAAGPLGEALDVSQQIDAARDRLVRAQDAAARPQSPVPLAAPDSEGLLSAFRGRLDALAADRSAILDQTEIVPDPERPALPRLRAVLRGTSEGLQGLMHALETESPLVAIEEADLGVERPADAETGRPGIMRIAFTTRGILLPPAKTLQGTSP